MSERGVRLDREQRQLVDELRAFVHGDPPPAPPEDLDETRFDALCDEHKVSSLLARVGGTPRRPSAKRAHLLTFAASTLVERRRDEAVATLAAAGVDALVLKGGDWAFRLYPDPGCRPMVDVDLLVRGSQMPQAVDALTSGDWRVSEGEETFLARGVTVGIEPPEAPRLRIELHPQLCQPSRYPIDVAALFARARPLAEGRPGRRMDDADATIYCAVHHALHGYRMPLLWLLDFALLLRACGPEAPLAERAREWGAVAALTTSSRLADALLGPLSGPSHLPPLGPAVRAYLRALITPDHLRMNRILRDGRARTAATLALLDEGRLRYLADYAWRRTTTR